MKTADLRRKVLPSLLAGTARQPLAGDAQLLAPLAALSLAGQMLRFTAPSTPSAFAIEPAIKDSRRILPDALRRPMLRLVAGKTTTEYPATAVARALNQLHLRPHPFDLPKLDTFVRTHAEQLGSTALHWAQRSAKNEEAASSYDIDALEDANWTQAPLSRRVLFLAQRRSQDPAAGRALLELAWPHESADARFRLLQTFHKDLNVEDVKVLTSIQKDRAPRVRALVRRMLAKLDIGVDNPALTLAMERLKRSQKGLLRKRTTLALELPATVKEQAAPAWIRQTFAEISVGELARVLSMQPLEVVEAASEDPNLLLALALMATLDARLDILEVVVQHLPDAWQRLSDTGLNEAGPMEQADRTKWADILVRAYGLSLPWDLPAWSWLYAMLDGPAPASLLDAAFRSEWFGEEPTVAKHTPSWMELTAALCPPPQRNELRRRLALFDAGLTVTAIMMLDFLDALEKETNRA